jgi:hypothetical protein
MPDICPEEESNILIFLNPFQSIHPMYLIPAWPNVERLLPPNCPWE